MAAQGAAAAVQTDALQQGHPGALPQPHGAVQSVPLPDQRARGDHLCGRLAANRSKPAGRPEETDRPAAALMQKPAIALDRRCSVASIKHDRQTQQTHHLLLLHSLPEECRGAVLPAVRHHAGRRSHCAGL